MLACRVNSCEGRYHLRSDFLSLLGSSRPTRACMGDEHEDDNEI